MRNFLLTLMFDGSAYHGWQVQSNAVTVQETLQDALERILGTRYPVTGCSRTDAGVHALEFCCNVRAETALCPERLSAALNAVLPRDVAVRSCREVPLDFHARYDCLGKTYQYILWNGKTRNPFYERRAYFYPYALDTVFLHGQAQNFVGRHDFSAFCAANSDVADRVRTIRSFSVERQGDLVRFTVAGGGFLYNMVRIMVGTLLDIQSGKLPAGCIPKILESLDRTKAGVTAPAAGLYLAQVAYNERDLFLNPLDVGR